MRHFMMGALGAAAATIVSQAAMAADVYVIDAAHSTVQFSVDRFGFAPIIGRIADVKGELALDEASPENSTVSVVMTVASLESGDATRDGHLKGPFWFDAEKFPTMEFRSTRILDVDDAAATVVGVLSLHGAEAPVTLKVRRNKIGEDPATKRKAAGFSATAKLKRSAFGMNTAAGLIGDDVDIRIEALAHLKS
jgi:polyisoprenoid-binding protein YceI